MVKVGDKVRVNTDTYCPSCPRGTVCTVVKVHRYGCIYAKIDGGDGFEWYLGSGEYEPISVECSKNVLAMIAKTLSIKVTVKFEEGCEITYDGT